MKNPDAVTTEFAVDRLERELLLQLIRGQYRAGDFLPSTVRLTQLTSCSVNTIRSAVGRLLSRGLLTYVPGEGIRVEELLESCDIELLLMIISDKCDAERALELEAQLLDLMSLVFFEVVYRAAGTRSDDHMKWFNHYLRNLLDQVDQDTHVAYLADTQFQLLKVLSAAGGSVAYTVLLNAFRAYLNSAAALELFPPESWQQLVEALQQKDVVRARQVFQRCFDRRTSKVLELLAKARGVPGDENGGPPTVELVEWGPAAAKSSDSR